MQITVKGKGFDLGEALQTHATTTLNDAMTKYFDRGQEGEMVITHEHNMFSVRIHAHVPGSVLPAECENADPYTAVNSAIAKLSAQLKRHKEKLRDHHDAAATKTGSLA